jgi:hypothetical protein
MLRRGPLRTLKKEWIPFLEGTCFGEASADYLIGCPSLEKVALGDLSLNLEPATPFPGRLEVTSSRPFVSGAPIISCISWRELALCRK